MKAIDKICAKKLSDCTPLEKAVRMYLREDAAEELARLLDISKKAERFVRSDGRHDPQALYLELRRCFLDDK